ncbi:hypothetical protein GCM10022205_04190 [Spinactinospora alkalitolerans]
METEEGGCRGTRSAGGTLAPGPRPHVLAGLMFPAGSTDRTVETAEAVLRRA